MGDTSFIIKKRPKNKGMHF